MPARSVKGDPLLVFLERDGEDAITVMTQTPVWLITSSTVVFTLDQAAELRNVLTSLLAAAGYPSDS